MSIETKRPIYYHVNKTPPSTVEMNGEKGEVML